MGKIKLNLVSGAVVEKPLINAFKANNNSYVILDNEMNGSMGLPIILVCKFEENKLTKILDQNEWSIVKEYLKNIIAGNQIEFINVESELTADDIYYTQLTLPVPSFDALKNAYKVEEVTSTDNTGDSVMNMLNETPVVEATPEVVNPTPVLEQPVIEPVVSPQQEPSSVDPAVEPVVESPIVNMESPVIDMPVNPEPVVAPEVSAPVVENVDAVVSPMDIVSPVTPEAEITPTPVIEPTVEPVVEVSVNTDNVVQESIFKEQKEAFMQACENMFDALVQKFERELENHE